MYTLYVYFLGMSLC